MITWVDEQVMASPRFVLSCVFERAAQLIGLDDIFKVKKLMGNRGEEVWCTPMWLVRADRSYRFFHQTGSKQTQKR